MSISSRRTSQKSCQTTSSKSFSQLLQRLSPEVAASLTPIQTEALRLAMQGVQSGSHAVDLRLTIPFPHRGFYFVLLAGRERRSVKRLRAENQGCTYATLLSSLALLGLLAAVTVPGILWVMRAHQASEQSEIHPTAIPWLQDQKACEATGRTWEDNSCWEDEWSPMF